MKQVKLVSVEVENFCNHIDPIGLNFEKNQTTILVGANGSGKTSLIQSIPYAFYGSCEKGKGEDVLNNKTGKKCRIIVKFEVDSDKYEVIRYVKYPKIGTTVTLSKNDPKNITHTGSKEVIPEIERIVLPKKLFNNTLLFGQKVKTFFTDLNDSEQKDIFRKILKLDNYILYGNIVKKRIKESNEFIIEMTTDIKVKDELILSNNELIISTKKSRDSFKEEKKRQLLVLESSIKVLTNSKNELIEKLESFDNDLDKKLAELIKQYTISQQELTKTDEKLKEVDEMITANSELKRLEIERDADAALVDIKKVLSDDKKLHNEDFDADIKVIERLRDKSESIRDDLIHKSKVELSPIEFIEIEIKELEKTKALSECPTCKRLMNDEGEETINFKIEELSNKIKEIKNIVEKRKKHITEKDESVKSLNNEIKRLNKLREEKLKEVDDDYKFDYAAINERLTSALNKLNALIEVEKEKRKSQINIEDSKLKDEVIVIRNQIKITEKKIEDRKEIEEDIKTTNNDLSNEESLYKSKLEEEFDNSQLIELEKKIIKLKKLIEGDKKNREKEILTLEALEFWKEGFSSSGIQSMLIDDSIPFLNHRVKYYMDKICNGRYAVSFDTLSSTKAGEFRDKISVELFDTETHSDDRVKFSGGQERMVDIGIILSLGDLQSMIQGVEFNILMFDEIFDALDDSNIEYVSALLNQLSKDRHIVVISHRHIDNLNADEELRF